MKRLSLVAILLLGAVCAHADYWPQNDPRSGGMRDLMLLYTCTPDHYTQDDLRPYVAYLDKKQDGRPVDWFYDSYLFLTIFGSPSGALYDTGATNLVDWRYFLDLLFKSSMNLRALDDAIAWAAETLGPPPRKVPVVLMMPYPSPEQKDFGIVPGSDHSLDLSNFADARRAVDWVIGESTRRFEAGQYRHVSLWGFYWMKEFMPKSDEELVKLTAGLLHDRGLGLNWIPASQTRTLDHWQDLGLDFVVLQPNYSNRELLGLPREEQQLPDIAAECRQYRVGVGVEVAPGCLHTNGDRLNLYDYLNYGVPEREGYMKAIHMYYQTIVDIGLMYASDVPADNRLYRSLYEFHKQTYREHPACLSEGLPCRVVLPVVGATGTLALTGDRPAPERAVAIPGSGGSIIVDLPTDRRLHKVFLHARMERTAPGTLAFAEFSAQERNGALHLIAAGINPPFMDTEPGFQWWRLSGPPQIGRSAVIQFTGPPGGRLIVDQVRLFPAADPGLDGTCRTDGTGDGQALTDREFATGDRDDARLVRWPGGKGSVTLGIPDDRHIATLLLHAVKPPGGQWPARVRMTCGGQNVSAEVAVPPDDWASYVPVQLPLKSCGQLKIELEGAADRPMALDEAELQLTTNLALGQALHLRAAGHGSDAAVRLPRRRTQTDRRAACGGVQGRQAGRRDAHHPHCRH